MTIEVGELLSWAVLDTSGIVSWSSTPKRPGSLAVASLLLLKPEDSTQLVDTSSQVSAQEDEKMDDPTLEEIHASLPPGQNSGAQWGSSLCGCSPTPGGGQQGPGTLVGDQIFPQCLAEEASLWLWDDPLSNCISNLWGHQGSKGPLCSQHLGCGDLPNSAHEQSQSTTLGN